MGIPRGMTASLLLAAVAHGVAGVPASALAQTTQPTTRPAGAEQHDEPAGESGQSQNPIPLPPALQPDDDGAIAAARAVAAEAKTALQRTTAPTTAPAGAEAAVYDRRVKAEEALLRTLDAYLSALDSLAADRAEVMRLGSEEASQALQNQISGIEARAEELRQLLGQEPLSLEALNVEKARDTYATIDKQTDELREAQAKREEALSDFDAQRQTATSKLTEADKLLSAFQNQATTQPAADEDSKLTQALEERHLQWAVATARLGQERLNYLKTRLSIERKNAADLLEALTAYQKQVGEWQTTARKRAHERERIQIEQKLKMAKTKHDRLIWEGRKHVLEDVNALNEIVADAQKRFPEADENRVNWAVDRSSATWTRFINGLDRYDTEEKRKRYNEIHEEIQRWRSILADIETKLTASERDYDRILWLSDTHVTTREKLESGLNDAIKAIEDNDKKVEARAQATRLAAEFFDPLEKQFDDAADAVEKKAIERLQAAADKIKKLLTQLAGARDDLYWSQLLAAEIGWFNPDWTALKADVGKLTALWQEPLPGDVDAAALAAAGPAVVAWVHGVPRLDGALFVALAAAAGGVLVWRGRIARQWAAQRAETLVERMKEQQTSVAPLSDRIALHATTTGMATAAWAVPLGVLLTAVTFLPSADDVGESLIRAALLLVLGAGLSLAVVRFAFASDKPRFRVLPCGNIVAAYYMRWARILVIFSVVALPLPLLLYLTKSLGLLREYYLGIYKGLVLLGVLLFLRHRQTVIRVVGRVQNLKYQRLYRLVVGLYPLGFVVVLLLFVMEVLGHGPFTTFVIEETSMTAAALVIAYLLIRLLDDLLAKFTQLAEATETETPAAAGTDEDEHALPLLDPTQVAVAVATVFRWFIIIGTAVVIAACWGMTRNMLHDVLNYGWELDGGRRITVWRVGASVLIMVATVFISRALRGMLQRRVYDTYLPLDRGAQAAVNMLLHYSLICLGVYFAMSALHVTFGALAVLLGGLGLGLGLGLQPLIVNFVSGLMIILERHVKVGDKIEVNDTLGEVTRISMRATCIKTFDNVDIIVPNGQFINSSVVNWTLQDQRIRGKVNVGVAYGSDTRLVHDLLMRAARENKRVLYFPAPEAWFVSFGDSSLDFTLVVWFADTRERWSGMIELRYEIDRLFREHNIEIPFPQRTLSIKGDQPLTVRLVRDASDAPPAAQPGDSPAPPWGPAPTVDSAAPDVGPADSGDAGNAPS